MGRAGEGDMLDVAPGEGARVVVATVEAGDGGDAELAEEVCVVLRAEDAATAVDVSPHSAGWEACVGGWGAEEKDAIWDDGEDLTIDRAAEKELSVRRVQGGKCCAKLREEWNLE
jgi:hypothetical protein